MCSAAADDDDIKIKYIKLGAHTMVKVDYIVIKKNLPTPEFIKQYHKKLYCNIRFCQRGAFSLYNFGAKEVKKWRRKNEYVYGWYRNTD